MCIGISVGFWDGGRGGSLLNGARGKKGEGRKGGIVHTCMGQQQAINWVIFGVSICGGEAATIAWKHSNTATSKCPNQSTTATAATTTTTAMPTLQAVCKVHFVILSTSVHTPQCQVQIGWSSRKVLRWCNEQFSLSSPLSHARSKTRPSSIDWPSF